MAEIEKNVSVEKEVTACHCGVQLFEDHCPRCVILYSKIWAHKPVVLTVKRIKEELDSLKYARIPEKMRWGRMADLISRLAVNKPLAAASCFVGYSKEYLSKLLQS